MFWKKDTDTVGTDTFPFPPSPYSLRYMYYQQGNVSYKKNMRKLSRAAVCIPRDCSANIGGLENLAQIGPIQFSSVYTAGG